MRLICTFNDRKKAHLLSSFLMSEGIENQLEISKNVDWGSPNYSDLTCKIWIYDEDKVTSAFRWLEMFDANPDNPIFQGASREASSLQKEEVDTAPKSPAAPVISQTVKQTIRTPEKMGMATFYLIFICCILFLLDMLTTPHIVEPNLPANLPLTPLLSSPIKKELYYDFPQAYVIEDRIAKIYGIDKLGSPHEMPAEGQFLLKKFYSTSYWQGLYEIVLKKIQNPHAEIPNIPLFEKIREGEIWRLFTPSLLHNDILHILFNMLWLVLLGKQIEHRLRMGRYLLFILIAGIFSNTCQYLMSGANFIGFSGVLCAMLTFIWMRQKTAPWEAYPLPKSTVTFMMFFILSICFLQLISFYLETKQQIFFSPGMANTAHLSGALLGVVLGRFSFFASKI